MLKYRCEKQYLCYKCFKSVFATIFIDVFLNLMNKRIFILIVVLMSVSLVGIISVQVYWIKNAIKDKRQQFESNVTIALGRTSERVREKEENEAYSRYGKFFENEIFRTESEITNYLYQQIDNSGNKRFVYGTYLEEGFNIPTGFSYPDTTFVKKITSKKNFLSVEAVENVKDLGKEINQSSFSDFRRHTDYEKRKFAEILSQEKKLLPVHKRISSGELQNILKEEFLKRNISQEFKFGLYDAGFATSVKSGYFKANPNKDYYYPLFEDENGNSQYKLYVSFPEERKSLISGIMSVLLLSLLFISVIIATFSTSLYQLIRQKKISEIKTDFINNMTHEFKTPIATINLALDAIKNPKIISDEQKVKRYLKMIREENKRMHGQVESVLRISKLEKNQVEISKETVDMIDVIEDAIEHLQLLVSNKNGSITLYVKAINTEVLGNKFHLTNVMVNMLENAIKYSEGAPEIKVFTESTSKFFVCKVKDNGIGMSKAAQKHAFDKFYREHGGNVHNVKGHGLGLSYVKEIIDNHQGIVCVESEKGKGSTFTVRLPLI